MAKSYNKKWESTFPKNIGNQTRPTDAVDNTLEYETDGFPQHMANDPVRYDKMNAVVSQSMSNDERLNEKIKKTNDDLAKHNTDPTAHKTGISGNAATATKVVTTAAAGSSANIAEATVAGTDGARIRVSGTGDNGELALETKDDADGEGSESIVARKYTGDYANVQDEAYILDKNGNTTFPKNVISPKFTGALVGNAATATKLQTPRTISLSGKAAGSATFDGSSNAAINVTSVNADTASKLSTARKINITGNATGSTSFDGSGDVSINTTVNESKHAGSADRATQVVANAPTGDGLDVIHAIMGDNNAARVRVYGDTNNGALEIATGDDGTEPIYARQYVNSSIDKFTTVARTAAILDASGNTSFPGTVTAASFTGPLNGNATSATTATNVSGKIYYSADSPSVATDKLFTVKEANAGEDNVPNNGLVIQTGHTGAHFNGKLYITDNGNDGVWIGGVAEDKEVGWTRLVENKGTWNISISGNAASATNADKVDGYHASDLLGKIYPVGSIYMSMSATNPHDLFGVGTWKRISQGRMLLGADDSTYKAGATGGEATHTLTVNEIPAHSHGISTSGNHSHYFYGSDNDNGPLTEGDGLDTEGNSHFTRNVRFATSSAGAHTHTISNSGGGAAHNNMPPYLVCYIWQRTA